MSAVAIINNWKKNIFKPVYFLHGEEDYYIDKVINYAEDHLLPAAEVSFNLTIFYGRDVDKPQVENACKRYPMFADKQVVIIKEAQFMKDIDKLENYIMQPLNSTLLIIAYKGKTYDKRSKFYKTITKYAELFTSDKIKDDKVQGWILDLVKEKGLTISNKAATLMEQHIGNDLSRIANEIDKLTINLGARKNIDVDEIENYIGISKEYNVFELAKAIAYKDFTRAFTMVQYFENNPKAVPIQMALPALYSNFSRVYAAFGAGNTSDAALKPVFYNNYYSLEQGKIMMKNYGLQGIEQIILLLHQYNLKSIGIGEGGSNQQTLLREMLAKMML